MNKVLKWIGIVLPALVVIALMSDEELEALWLYLHGLDSTTAQR